jgi:hypothetical protein
MTRMSVVLPAPFGSDHGHRLPRLHAQAHVPQRGEGAVAGGDPVEREHAHVRTTFSPR